MDVYATVAEREIVPGGWIAGQMRHDLEHGFVGHLDQLAPDLLIEDDIFGRDRLTGAVTRKDLGALPADEEWSDQLLWWNAESQGNWRDGWLSHCLWVGGDHHRAAARRWVGAILAGQDRDGYLGIYSQGVRYPERGENGELWGQTVLLRALLGYARHAADGSVEAAVRRAVAHTMQGYPGGRSHPFGTERSWAGVTHGLMFVDVLWRLAQTTRADRYLAYAEWLYREFATSPHAEGDAQARALLDSARGFTGHGVHTYEHWRALTIARRVASAAGAAGELAYDELDTAYRAKLALALTPSGAPNGDEYAHPRGSAAETGYEYCSIQELLDSYAARVVVNGDVAVGDAMESLVLNSGFGARDPIDGSVAYLKTDNSYSMTGPEGFRPPTPGVVQTRYMYSPVHRQAALCCVPNAGRLLPTYLRHQWLRGDIDGLPQIVALLFGESTLRTTIGRIPVTIVQRTRYPAELSLALTVEVADPVEFVLSVRRPAWARDVRVMGVDNTQIEAGENLVHIRSRWSRQSELVIEFVADTGLSRTNAGEVMVSAGPLHFAEPLAGLRQTLRGYDLPGGAGPFRDVTVAPAAPAHHLRVDTSQRPRLAALPSDCDAAGARHEWQRQALAIRADTEEGTVDTVVVPLGATTLRRLTFPAA